MGVSIKKGGKVVREIGGAHPQALKAASQANLTKRGTVRIKAIKGEAGTAEAKWPQLTVKVAPERHWDLKRLASALQMSLRNMLAKAIGDFLAAPCTASQKVPAPSNAAQITFKVSPELFEQVREFANGHSLNNQTIITMAIDRLEGHSN